MRIILPMFFLLYCVLQRTVALKYLDEIFDETLNWRTSKIILEKTKNYFTQKNKLMADITFILHG